ncbi:MAG: late competence development ComFB family protein [Lachnospirales bacterium]
MEIKNYTETLVENNVRTIMEEMNMCTCNFCILDVMVIALNNLAPRYMIVGNGINNKTEETEIQNNVELYTAIVRACKIIKEKPRHI